MIAPAVLQCTKGSEEGDPESGAARICRTDGGVRVRETESGLRRPERYPHRLPSGEDGVDSAQDVQAGPRAVQGRRRGRGCRLRRPGEQRTRAGARVRRKDLVRGLPRRLRRGKALRHRQSRLGGLALRRKDVCRELFRRGARAHQAMQRLQGALGALLPRTVRAGLDEAREGLCLRRRALAGMRRGQEGPHLPWQERKLQ